MNRNTGLKWVKHVSSYEGFVWTGFDQDSRTAEQSRIYLRIYNTRLLHHK